jgi:mevalonate kinase
LSLVLTAPSKTFFLGEYLALSGGPSILISTTPRFSMNVTAAGSAGAKPGVDPHESISSLSPAGRYLARHTDDFKRYQFEFSDPHAGKGGLGASSAQFALLAALKNGWKTVDPANFDWQTIIEEYRACAWSGDGAKPSGADVVSQLSGGLTWYDGREFRAKHLEWKFPTLSFTLLRTGDKVLTHEHLRTQQPAPHEALREIVGDALRAFESVDEALLLLSVGRTTRLLAENELTSHTTLRLLKTLQTEHGFVRMAKGCGAMGADVLLVLHDRDKEAALKGWATAQGLEVCGSLADLSGGLAVEGSGIDS